jgi:hypothetical protein
MRFNVGDIVAFTHRIGGREVELLGKVIDFVVDAPDPEFVIRPLTKLKNLVSKERHELRPARA